VVGVLGVAGVAVVNLHHLKLEWQLAIYVVFILVKGIVDIEAVVVAIVVYHLLQTSNSAYWFVSYRGTRVNYTTEAEALLLLLILLLLGE
jgi:hypothetical protein